MGNLQELREERREQQRNLFHASVVVSPQGSSSGRWKGAVRWRERRQSGGLGRQHAAFFAGQKVDPSQERLGLLLLGLHQLLKLPDVLPVLQPPVVLELQLVLEVRTQSSARPVG